MLKHPLFRFFSSLKMAVVLILTLAFVLAIGTGLESIYGTRAVRAFVYATPWFSGLLFLLMVTLTTAAFSRYPWKRHQTGFVITHLGIIVTLIGAWLTSQFGVDGNLPVQEGAINSQVILTDLVLTIEKDEKLVLEQAVAEAPREVAGILQTVNFEGASLIMDRFLPRVAVEREINPSAIPGIGAPAIQVTLSNDRFKVTEWLIHKEIGEPVEINLGPAVLSFETVENESNFTKAGTKIARSERDRGMIIVDKGEKSYRVRIADALKGWMRLGGGLTLKAEKYFPYATVEKNQLVNKSQEPLNPAVTLVVKDNEGGEEKHTIFALYPEFATMHKSRQSGPKSLGLKLRMEAKSPQRGNVRGKLKFAQSITGDQLFYLASTESSGTSKRGRVKVGESIATGWMDLKFTVERWVSHSIVEKVPHYVDKVSGSDAGFVSAGHFRFEAAGTPGESFWLIEGAERVLPFTKDVVVVGLHRRTLPLPFQVQLDKFTIHHDPGSERAAGYESQVTVRGGPGDQSAKISMNEPLNYGGYTFYQASFQAVEGESPISIFSVNLDPGRFVKYAGSLLLTLGIILMFYMNPHYWNILLSAKKELK